MSAVPRRFRRRLLWALVLGAVLPTLAVGALASRVLGDVLSLTLAPIEQVLDRADEELQACGRDGAEVLGEARLSVAQAELARESLRRIATVGFGAVLLATLVISGLVAWLLGRAFARPVVALSDGLARVAAGEQTVQVAPPGPPEADELAFVVAQFNKMTTQLDEQRRRLEVTQRLAAWQDVARAMAHELKNPLTAMKMALGRIARIDPSARGETDRARLTESVSLLEEQVDALMRMTQSFSEFAKLPAAAPRPLELRALLDEVAALYVNHSAVGVKVAEVPALQLRADPDQLRRAVGNLVKNALEASPEGAAPVEVSADRGGGTVRIHVRDHGAGIPAPLRMGEFVEGHSQKPGGSGLGLPITQKIIHEHGGALKLEPAAGGGTVATIELPEERT